MTFYIRQKWAGYEMRQYEVNKQVVKLPDNKPIIFTQKNIGKNKYLFYETNDPAVISFIQGHPQFKAKIIQEYKP